jgi:hypothetical protein
MFLILIIALMMEAALTSETSVYNYFTRQYILEDKSELHTRRRENLKSHVFMHVYYITYTNQYMRYFLDLQHASMLLKNLSEQFNK